MTAITEIVNRELLGKPFKHWGRGPDHFDCLGVWIYLVRRVAGAHVPDFTPEVRGWFDDWDVTAIRRQLMDFGSRLKEEDDLQPLDLLHYRRPGCHVYTVESPRWVVHAEYGSVGRMPLNQVLRLRKLDRWRLRELDR